MSNNFWYLVAAIVASVFGFIGAVYLNLFTLGMACVFAIPAGLFLGSLTDFGPSEHLRSMHDLSSCILVSALIGWAVYSFTNHILAYAVIWILSWLVGTLVGSLQIEDRRSGIAYLGR